MLQPLLAAKKTSAHIMLGPYRVSTRQSSADLRRKLFRRIEKKLSNDFTRNCQS
jgi:hypothetical protein